MTPPKQRQRQAPGIVPPALGAVVQSLQEAGDAAADGLVRVSSPQALANTKADRREFHDRKKHAGLIRHGVLFINDKTLCPAQQRQRLDQIVALSLKTTTPNVFRDQWTTLRVAGVEVVAVAVDVLRYENSVVKRFVDSPKNTAGYTLFVK